MATKTGIVHVVGAGPDAPELITLRGHELLAISDAVIYDRRAQRGLIPGADGSGPKRYFVGARGDEPRPSLADVTQLAVALARSGQRVVVLTHGDPFDGGRGSELAQSLHDASVPYEIVPGIALGSAAATYSGIPLISPTMSSATVFANGGAERAGGVATDWAAVARVGGTVVVRDALKSLAAIVAGFAEAGVPDEIPVAVVTHAGQPSQRTLMATMSTVADAIERAGIKRGVVLVIGWSVLLRDELAWFDTRQLFGARVIVASQRNAPRIIGDRLRELGASVMDVPETRVARLELGTLRDALEHIQQYEWIVFASSAAVDIFWEQLLALGRDTRSLASAKIACVGQTTAASLLDRGITVDVVQERFELAPLLDVLAERPDVPGAETLLVSDDSGVEALTRDLEGAGASVTPVAAYREVPAEKQGDSMRRRMEAHPAQLAVVTSAGAAQEYARFAAGSSMTSIPVAVTSDESAEILREAGLEVVVEASGGIDEVIGAVVSYLRGRVRVDDDASDDITDATDGSDDAHESDGDASDVPEE